MRKFELTISFFAGERQRREVINFSSYCCIEKVSFGIALQDIKFRKFELFYIEFRIVQDFLNITCPPSFVTFMLLQRFKFLAYWSPVKYRAWKNHDSWCGIFICPCFDTIPCWNHTEPETTSTIRRQCLLLHPILHQVSNNNCHHHKYRNRILLQVT